MKQMALQMPLFDKSTSAPNSQSNLTKIIRDDQSHMNIISSRPKYGNFQTFLSTADETVAKLQKMSNDHPSKMEQIEQLLVNLMTMYANY